jgi:hypothetical protein
MITRRLPAGLFALSVLCPAALACSAQTAEFRSAVTGDPCVPDPDTLVTIQIPDRHRSNTWDEGEHCTGDDCDDDDTDYCFEPPELPPDDDDGERIPVLGTDENCTGGDCEDNCTDGDCDDHCTDGDCDDHCTGDDCDDDGGGDDCEVPPGCDADGCCMVPPDDGGGGDGDDGEDGEDSEDDPPPIP